MPKPKYYFFAFNEVITTTITNHFEHHYFSSSTSHERIRNAHWLNLFIKERHQAGDMIFVLSENPKMAFPRFYLERILGKNYAIYIKHIQFYEIDRTPVSIFEAIDKSLSAANLKSFQELKFDVVLITAKSACVDAIVDQCGDGILVKKNSDSYIKELEEVVRISNLDPLSEEAQTHAMLKGIKRASLRQVTQTTTASGVTERSPLVSQYGSAISRSTISVASQFESALYQSSTGSASPYGSAIGRSQISSAPPSGSAISRSSSSSASPSGSALRRSSKISAPPFSLGVRASTGENATFNKSNNDDFDDDNTSTRERRCRWCCC